MKIRLTAENDIDTKFLAECVMDAELKEADLNTKSTNSATVKTNYEVMSTVWPYFPYVSSIATAVIAYLGYKLKHKNAVVKIRVGNDYFEIEGPRNISQAELNVFINSIHQLGPDEIIVCNNPNDRGN